MNDSSGLMSVFTRLAAIERQLDRLKTKESPRAGAGGVTDHGALTGLLDNDHPQYSQTTHDHAGTYLPIAGKAADSDKLDGIDSTGFATAGHNHTGTYLPIAGKAADADKLDNIDSSGFVQTSDNQTVGGVKTFSSIPVLPATNPTLANQAVRKGYADAAYLSINGKAADADKLDGIDSTGFATSSHNHSGVYLPIAGKAADADKLDGVDSSAFGRPVFLTTPLTSTAWDGDSYSSALKTLIDLSSVFSVPAGVKAVLVQLIARDSGSAASTNIFFGISPNDTGASCPVIAVGRGLPNDTLVYSTGVCPCDANGDIYYQIVASGVGTMDCYIRIWGYWL